MSDVKWIKLSINMFDDEKIKLIKTLPEGDKIIVVWIQLLCLAGKTNDGGLVYMGQNMVYTEEMLATIFDEQVNVIRVALQALEQFGLIEISDKGLIGITNWEKHQSTDKMARMKEQSRIRQQKYYYRSKLRELGVNVDNKEFTDDLDELKTMYEELEKPNVRLTLANETEVRSKKEEVRGKKKEVRSKKDIVSSSDEQDSIPYKEVVSYLNDKTGSKYRTSTEATRTLIRSRFKEGFELDDFKKVIDNKTNDWLNDKKMAEYLRPQTLFGTKFESYLNQISNNRRAGNEGTEYDDFF